MRARGRQSWLTKIVQSLLYMCASILSSVIKPFELGRGIGRNNAMLKGFGTHLQARVRRRTSWCEDAPEGGVEKTLLKPR